MSPQDSLGVLAHYLPKLCLYEPPFWSRPMTPFSLLFYCLFLLFPSAFLFHLCLYALHFDHLAAPQLAQDCFRAPSEEVYEWLPPSHSFFSSKNLLRRIRSYAKQGSLFLATLPPEIGAQPHLRISFPFRSHATEVCETSCARFLAYEDLAMPWYCLLCNYSSIAEGRDSVRLFP